MDKLLSKLSREQRVMLENLSNNLRKNVLGFWQVHFPYYTDHGVQHAKGIIKQLCHMLPDEVIGDMNSSEVLILLCSAWLHDIGLLTNVDEKGKSLRAKEIRDRHHELSRYLVRRKYKELGLADHDIAELVADVCFSHRKQVDIHELYAETTLGVDKVRVRFLAALLRLADAMDTGSKRAPRILYQEKAEDLWKFVDDHDKEEIKRHWRACHLISGINYATEKLAIIVDSRYEDDEEKKLIFWKFKDLYREFLPIRELLIENGLNYSDLVQRLYDINAQCRLEISGNMYFGKMAIDWGVLRRVSDKWTRLTLDSLKTKYKPRLYVNRKKIENEFKEFLNNDKVGFTIIGDTGYGKTNLLCHLAQKYRHSNLVLFYNSSSLSTLDIKEQVMNDLCPTPEFKMATFFEEFMNEIAEILEEKNKFLIIFIDAINEAENPRVLLKNINEAVGRRINSNRIKVVLACRTIIWNLLLDVSNFLYRSKYYTVRGESEIRLDEFTDEELRAVYELYKQYYQLKTDFNDLSKRTRGSCKVPLLLRMISEVYKGKVIPPYVPLGTVFDEWYTKMIERDMQILLERIVEMMVKHKAAYLTLHQLTEDPDIAKCFSDSSPGSPYVKLLDRGILDEKGKHPQIIRFTFDRFFEYLLAEKVLPREQKYGKDYIISLISQAEDFNSILGAIKIALIIKKDPTLLSELATEESYDLRKILVDTLTTMSEYDFDMVYRLLKDWLRSGPVPAKRAAIQTVYEMGQTPIDILEIGMLSSNRNIRSLATQYAYLIWQRDHEKGFQILQRTISKVRTKLGINRRAFESALEFSFNIILLHHNEREAISRLQNHWILPLKESFIFSPSRSRTVRLLKEKMRKTMVSIAVRLMKKYIEKFFFVPEMEEAIPDELHFSPKKMWCFFELPKLEKEKVSSAVRYLDPDVSRPSEIVEIILELLKAESPIPIAVGCGLVIIQALELDDALPFFNLLPREDVVCRSAVLSALSVLGRKEPDRAIRFMNEYLKGDIYDEVSVFGSFLLEVGMMFSKINPGKEITPIVQIMEKAERNNDQRILRRAIYELGNSGITFPVNALLTLHYAFHTTHKEVRKTLIESLAKIRIVHPDITERYLERERPELLGEIKAAEVNLSIVTGGAVMLLFTILFEFPILKRTLINILSRLSDYDNENDFLKFAVQSLFEYVI